MCRQICYLRLQGRMIDTSEQFAASIFRAKLSILGAISHFRVELLKFRRNLLSSSWGRTTNVVWEFNIPSWTNSTNFMGPKVHYLFRVRRSLFKSKIESFLNRKSSSWQVHISTFLRSKTQPLPPLCMWYPYTPRFRSHSRCLRHGSNTKQRVLSALRKA